MGLFDRHAGLLEAYRDVRTTGLDPFQIRMERVLSPTEAIINGKPTLLVGTNNYFGLTFDPSCMDALVGSAEVDAILPAAFLTDDAVPRLAAGAAQYQSERRRTGACLDAPQSFG